MTSSVKLWTENTLNWIQRIVRTDIRYLIRGGFWLSLVTLLSAIATFILAIIFANYFPAETYGTYKYVLSVFTILTLTSLTGMRVALVRATASGFAGSLVSAVRASFSWGMVGTLTSIGIAVYYFALGNSMLGTAFLVASIFVPLGMSLSLYHGVLQGRKKFGLSARYTMVTNLATVGTVIITVLLTDSLLYVLVAYLLPGQILRYFFLRRTIERERIDDAKEDKATVLFGKHLSVAKAFVVVADQLDKVLIWHYLGPIAVAVYAFAFAPVLQFKNVIHSILPLTLPKFASKNLADLKESLLYKIIIMTLGIVVLVVGYILAAPLLYRLVFPKFISSIHFSQLLALSLLLLPRGFLLNALKAHAKTARIYVLEIFGSLLKIVLLLILLPLYGINGAVYALLIAGLFSYILAIYLFRTA